jgi:hypothetical protein
MKLMRLLFFLLALSLILQNTCPYGFAAKTAFAFSHLHQCPLHHQTGEQETVDGNPNKAIHPAFVMAASHMQPSIRHFSIGTDYWPIVSDRYTNPFKDPLIRPPIS